MKKAITIISILALVAVLGVALVACGGGAGNAPADVEAGKAKMLAAGYAVETSEVAVIATKGDITMTATLYGSEVEAKGVYESVKLANSFGAGAGDVEKSGNWVCVGDKAAIDAFLK